MKNIWFFIAVFAVISCKNEAPVDYAILSGKISNKGAGELTFNSADRTVKKVITVGDDGSFMDTLRVNTETYVLYDGKNRINVYVEPGSTINVNYDATDFDNTLVISGIGSEISNYLYEVGKNDKKLRGPGTSVYLLEEGEYKSKFNEIKMASEELLKTAIGVEEAYKVKEKRNLNYAYLSQINIYEMYHAHYAKQPDFKISKDFLKELDGFKYDNEEDFLFSSNYKNIVTSHFSKEAANLAKTDSIAEDIAFLNVAGAIVNETIKNSLLFDNAKYAVTYTDDLEAFYTAFMASSTNKDNNEKITESYTKLKSVSKGQPSPKFVGYENFKGGTTSLDDLKGKFVYVDVWATWCGPCKREIPFLKEIEKTYHNKNIEFVSISVDKAKDHDKWVQMVTEKELKGIQLFSDKDWESDFVTGYLIKGIPRFILIDPNGNIVNSNAPRPSDSKLIDLFNELNI